MKLITIKGDNYTIDLSPKVFELPDYENIDFKHYIDSLEINGHATLEPSLFTYTYFLHNGSTKVEYTQEGNFLDENPKLELPSISVNGYDFTESFMSNLNGYNGEWNNNVNLMEKFLKGEFI